MRLGVFAIVLFALGPVFSGPTSVFAQESVAAALVVDSENRFAMDLYAQLKAQPGNLFFSPYSISTAMNMVYAGARGDTAREVARVFYISIEGDGWHRALSGQMKALSGAEGYELTVANSLWGQTGYVFLPAYLSLIKDYYGGELEQVDFAQASVAAGRINTWVSVKTNEKIKQVVASGSLGEMTRLVLINAVYFKGAWDSPFKKIHTENGRFYVTPQKDKIVSMMQQLGNFLYMENELVQVLELPYAGKDLSLMIVLPRKADGLTDVEGSLHIEQYNNWIAGLSNRQVDVTLPQFKNTSEFSLVQALAAMGVKDAFSPAANFSGMSQEEGGLQISDVIHKTFVDVTEEGAEAAAVTAVVMVDSVVFEAPSSTAVSFIADHPFFYVIRDRRSDMILFMGRILDPDVGARQVGDVLSGVWSEVVGQALQSQRNIHAEAGKPDRARE